MLKLDDRFENFRTVKIKHLKLQLANNQFLVKSLKSGRLIDMRGRFEGRGVIVRLFSFGSVMVSLTVIPYSSVKSRGLT